MARVSFTQNLQRHVPCGELQVPGETVRAVLENAFREEPRLRDYVLDEQATLRKHVVVFVDGEQVADRESLADPVAAGSHVHVMQALSGG